MQVKTVQARPGDEVKQFSVFTENRLGRLHDLIGLFESQNVHVLALTTLDTTDSSILRMVVDDPDRARRILNEQRFPYTESDLLVVEIDSERKLKGALSVLVMAEININYVYSFIARPEGRSAVAFSLEDRDVAEQALAQQQFKVLKQSDISR
ncbi:MAG: acetolactate synthase [Verrucomicrobia bacterium]|nr:acetolactate synthase [Verrucomicrobiota bacterium]